MKTTHTMNDYVVAMCNSRGPRELGIVYAEIMHDDSLDEDCSRVLHDLLDLRTNTWLWFYEIDTHELADLLFTLHREYDPYELSEDDREIVVQATIESLADPLDLSIYDAPHYVFGNYDPHTTTWAMAAKALLMLEGINERKGNR